MHAFVEILFLDVDVAIEMDDADPLVGALRDAADARESDRVIAAEHDRQRARGEHVGDTARNLVKALFEVGGNREDVAGIAERHLLAQIDAELVIVGRVERRNAPYALRPETGPRAIGGAGIEGNADHGSIVFRDVAHVLDIGRLHEGVDAGEMRQLAARERRNIAIGQAVGAGQPHIQRPLPLLAPACAG